jgi:hypothetical protein
MNDTRRVFEGEIYVRPMYRGVTVTDTDGNDMHFEDWVAEALGLDSYVDSGGASVRLTLEILGEVTR